jgi:phosphatidylglycerol:prolipoprotein diacylglycerol transferase
MPLAYWVHNLDPFLIRFSENFGVRYYGLAYLLGFAAAAGLLLLYHRRGRSPHGAAAISDLITALVLGVLLGGRLGYFLLYRTEVLRHDPAELLRLWEGGMASHGAFVGVLVALAWWSRRHRGSLLGVADLVVTTVPAGLCLGRIANFINGELVGRITHVPWAVIFPGNEFDRQLLRPFPRHPSQLYQAALEGLLLFAYLQWRFWRGRPETLGPGRLSGEFLLGYALARIIGELFREPDAPLLLGLSRGTFYSLFLVAAGSFLILRSRRPAAGGERPP